MRRRAISPSAERRFPVDVVALIVMRELLEPPFHSRTLHGALSGYWCVVGVLIDQGVLFASALREWRQLDGVLEREKCTTKTDTAPRG